ncbi:hypothetical protein RRF57_002524 [Xylaria bambusicola]|uniref:Uncharacterized protein n=1 Tax=Xylaria bambusicola TaxID=326684 RepID=A0AAN7UT08_9PEZI
MQGISTPYLQPLLSQSFFAALLFQVQHKQPERWPATARATRAVRATTAKAVIAAVTVATSPPQTTAPSTGPGPDTVPYQAVTDPIQVVITLAMPPVTPPAVEAAAREAITAPAPAVAAKAAAAEARGSSTEPHYNLFARMMRRSIIPRPIHSNRVEINGYHENPALYNTMSTAYGLDIRQKQEQEQEQPEYGEYVAAPDGYGYNYDYEYYQQTQVPYEYEEAEEEGEGEEEVPPQNGSASGSRRSGR